MPIETQIAHIACQEVDIFSDFDSILKNFSLARNTVDVA